MLKIKHMLWTLSTFRKFESVPFDNFKLGAAWRYCFIHLPVFIENLFVDELQGTKFEFEANDTRGWPRVFRVAYSGPKMDVLRIFSQRQWMALLVTYVRYQHRKRQEGK